MSGPDTKLEALARDAATSIKADRQLAEQLALLPEGELLPSDDGRPRRGGGKALNQMRDWLASRGFRMPEDVLAEIAGLNSREDAILTAIAATDRILAAAARRGENRVWDPAKGWVVSQEAWTPSPQQWLETFRQVYALQLKAAEALMPYGMPKSTPEVNGNVLVNQIIVPGAAPQPVQGGDRARDVTPSARRIAPPPMPGQMQQNQQVSGEGDE